jgi:hypothetical protein
MNHEQAINALANLIMSYANRDDIPQEERGRHLFCVETLRRARRGEITYLEAANAMEAFMAAK